MDREVSVGQALKGKGAAGAGAAGPSIEPVQDDATSVNPSTSRTTGRRIISAAVYGRVSSTVEESAGRPRAGRAAARQSGRGRPAARSPAR